MLGAMAAKRCRRLVWMSGVNTCAPIMFRNIFFMVPSRVGFQRMEHSWFVKSGMKMMLSRLYPYEAGGTVHLHEIPRDEPRVDKTWFYRFTILSSIKSHPRDVCIRRHLSKISAVLSSRRDPGGGRTRLLGILGKCFPHVQRHGRIGFPIRVPLCGQLGIWRV